MDWLDAPLDWARANETAMWWVFATTVAMFLLTPLVVGWLIVRLPRDYFTARQRPESQSGDGHSRLRPALVMAKNLLGIVLILAGLIMLLVPGQGLLTVAAGLVLVDFPGKYRLERWVATRPAVWTAINWVRRRAGREPLERPG
jgi:hypothetical protein